MATAAAPGRPTLASSFASAANKKTTTSSNMVSKLQSMYLNGTDHLPSSSLSLSSKKQKQIHGKTSKAQHPVFVSMLERLQTFDPKQVGLGGLDAQFLKVLFNIFLQTALPVDLQRETGVHTPAGILLYGEPGTGKTTLAKAIFDLLMNMMDPHNRKKKRQHEPTLVLPGDILAGIVGGSEANIKKLFAPAREAAKKLKNKETDLSSVQRLFVIIIDELEAICPIRNVNQGGGDGVPTDNKVVSTFLSELDGLHNDPDIRILVIGMTNMPHAIDPAMLRSGRLSIQIHVPLPTWQGRCEIFKIKLNHLHKEAHINLSADDYALLATETVKFTGADIEEVVRRAIINWLGQSIQQIIDIQHKHPLADEFNQENQAKEDDDDDDDDAEEQRPKIYYASGTRRSPQWIGLSWCPHADDFLKTEVYQLEFTADTDLSNSNSNSNNQRDLKNALNRLYQIIQDKKKYSCFDEMKEVFQQNPTSVIQVRAVRYNSNENNDDDDDDYDDESDDDDDDDDDDEEGQKNKKQQRRFACLQMSRADLMEAIEEIKIEKNIPLHSRFSNRKALCERHHRTIWMPLRTLVERAPVWYRTFVSISINGAPGSGRTTMIRSIIAQYTTLQPEILDVGLEFFHPTKSLKVIFEEMYMRAEKSKTGAIIVVDGFDKSITESNRADFVDFVHVVERFARGARYADGCIHLFYPLVFVLVSDELPDSFGYVFDHSMGCDLSLKSIGEVREACDQLKNEHFVFQNVTDETIQESFASGHESFTVSDLLKFTTNAAAAD